MNIKLRSLCAISVLSLFPGCAFVDRTILRPSAEMARVPPLFRTEECINYVVPDGDSYKPGNWHNPFIKNACEEQALSLPITRVTVEAENGKQEEKVQSVDYYSNHCQSDFSEINLNECSAFLMRTSDEICNVHLSRIFGDRAVTNVTLGMLAAGTGIAGGLVSGLQAANALSGAAGFLTGSRALLNEEVYRNYIAEAIIKEILGNREVQATTIRRAIENGASGGTTGVAASPKAQAPKPETSMKEALTEDLKITGIEQILHQVAIYHNECSFYAGLTSLAGKAGTQTSQVSAAATIQKEIDALTSSITKLEDSLKTATSASKKAEIQKQLDSEKSRRNALETFLKAMK